MNSTGEHGHDRDVRTDWANDAEVDGVAGSLEHVSTLVRRVVAGKVPNRDVTDEIVQETLTRLLGARVRLDDESLGPYAVVTARNLVAAYWRRAGTAQRHEHKLFDPAVSAEPSDALTGHEEAKAIRVALERLQPRERDVLVGHELEGRDTRSLAAELRSTPGAVAAQLSRSRAKLRVEYLLELNGEPPDRRCRPVLLALSSGDRRRQAEVGAGYHLLDCEYCAELTEPLLDRRSKPVADEVHVAVQVDQDIVIARQRGRDVAVHAGFSATESTMIATAVSEIARNIVRFARRGEMTFSIVTDGGRSGILVVARDVGPGIADVDLAMTVGYTTYGGRGLGLPGSRRLMDEFEITSEVGRGTTVTMTKWHRS